MDPRDWLAFLDQACGDDAGLRKEVESLLAAADRTLSYLREPALEAARQIAGNHSFCREADRPMANPRSHR
jgi:hypothetical protein